MKVFGNFDKEIYKIILTTYSPRGMYEITRESFENYVKKKTDQINKIWKDFDSPKNPPTKFFPKNDKITHTIERKKEKVPIGEK